MVAPPMHVPWGGQPIGLRVSRGCGREGPWVGTLISQFSALISTSTTVCGSCLRVLSWVSHIVVADATLLAACRRLASTYMALYSQVLITVSNLARRPSGQNGGTIGLSRPRLHAHTPGVPWENGIAAHSTSAPYCIPMHSGWVHVVLTWQHACVYLLGSIARHVSLGIEPLACCAYSAAVGGSGAGREA